MAAKRTFAKKITSILLLTSFENVQAHHFHLKSAPLETECFVRPTFTPAPPTIQVLDSPKIESHIEKPIVSDHDYMCALGAYFNLTCDQVWKAHEPFEESRLKDTEPPLAPDAPYLIEPKTHRAWLTSPENPKEVPVDRLPFYEKSLKLYAGESFEHHFWCNGVHLIPETIAAIQRFNVPIIIHDMSEIFENFTNKNLFKKLMSDKFFAFAANILRQEIVLQMGGLYMDIGLEQIQDLKPYFKKYEGLLFSSKWNFMIDTVFGAKKGSPLLKESLALKKQFPDVLPLVTVKPNPKEFTVQRLNSYHSWRVVMAQMEGLTPPLVITNFTKNFVYHGFKSWVEYKNLYTTDYFPREEDILQNTLMDKSAQSNTSSPSHEKPLVPEYEYLCALGAVYNLSCSQVWDVTTPYEEVHLKDQGQPMAPDAPYLIEPNTHRMWLTSPQNPQEVSLDRLAHYEQSLQFYGEHFKHHFWCNGIHLIPQTIDAILKFNVPVIIHHINEIKPITNKNLFQKLMQDQFFAFASNIIRQEILLQKGGIYMDIGLEQTRNLEFYFKKYESFYFTNKWVKMMDGVFAAKKGDLVLKESLLLKKDFPFILNQLSVLPDPKKFNLQRLNTLNAWRITMAQNEGQLPPMVLLDFYESFNYHGFESWMGYKTKFTIDYYPVETAGNTNQ